MTKNKKPSKIEGFFNYGYIYLWQNKVNISFFQLVKEIIPHGLNTPITIIGFRSSI